MRIEHVRVNPYQDGREAVVVSELQRQLYPEGITLFEHRLRQDKQKAKIDKTLKEI